LGKSEWSEAPKEKNPEIRERIGLYAKAFATARLTHDVRRFTTSHALARRAWLYKQVFTKPTDTIGPMSFNFSYGIRIKCLRNY
jgi:hypothetical protein